MWVNQIFSIVGGDKKVRNIIVADNYGVADTIAKDTIGLEAYAVDTTQYPVSIGDEYIDGKFYRDEVEIPRNLTADEEASLARAKVEELNAQVNPTINPTTCTVEDLKKWQIKLSKSNLKTYLECNPVFSTCHTSEGGYYSITEDKQNLLLGMISITQMKDATGVAYQPSWNETGKPCTYDWTITELMQLASEIESFIRPLISHQQTIEAAINQATTKDEIVAISITY